MFHTVQPDSGSMELWLFRKPKVRQILLWGCLSFLRRKNKHKACGHNVGHYLVRKFTIHGDQPLFLQLDGEAVSLTDNREFQFECLPGAVHVLMA